MSSVETIELTPLTQGFPQSSPRVLTPNYIIWILTWTRYRPTFQRGFVESQLLDSINEKCMHMFMSRWMPLADINSGSNTIAGTAKSTNSRDSSELIQILFLSYPALNSLSSVHTPVSVINNFANIVNLQFRFSVQKG